MKTIAAIFGMMVSGLVMADCDSGTIDRSSPQEMLERDPSGAGNVSTVVKTGQSPRPTQTSKSMSEVNALDDACNLGYEAPRDVLGCDSR